MYQVRLENFEGPLDLLLFFIRRDEIDIMDIPISRITREYLEYLDALESLNIAIAGEFVLMAATLMRIKAKMLLPSPSGLEEDTPEDPRLELARQLWEYQKFKEASEQLNLLRIEENQKFSRPPFVAPDIVHDDPAYYLEEISLFQLAKIFHDIIQNMPPPVIYEVEREENHVREKMAFLMSLFMERSRYSLTEMISRISSRREIIHVFLAVLEMVRESHIRVRQNKIFGEVILEKLSHSSSKAEA